MSCRWPGRSTKRIRLPSASTIRRLARERDERVRPKGGIELFLGGPAVADDPAPGPGGVRRPRPARYERVRSLGVSGCFCDRRLRTTPTARRKVGAPSHGPRAVRRSPRVRRENAAIAPWSPPYSPCRPCLLVGVRRFDGSTLSFECGKRELMATISCKQFSGPDGIFGVKDVAAAANG
jgi:hypothetical protein